MLKIMRPVTEWQEFEMDLEEFDAYIKEIRVFDNTMRGFGYLKEPNLTLYRKSGDHFIAGCVDIPTSIFPGAPERKCDWDDYAREHIEIIYNYLVEKGQVL